MAVDYMDFLRGNNSQVLIPEHLCDFLTEGRRIEFFLTSTFLPQRHQGTKAH
jgi:hypothetical protein